MVVDTVDPGGELRFEYSPWWAALGRAVGFELAGSVTAEVGDPWLTETVRLQHRQNAALLRRLIWPSEN